MNFFEGIELKGRLDEFDGKVYLNHFDLVRQVMAARCPKAKLRMYADFVDGKGRQLVTPKIDAKYKGQLYSLGVDNKTGKVRSAPLGFTDWQLVVEFTSGHKFYFSFGYTAACCGHMFLHSFYMSNPTSSESGEELMGAFETLLRTCLLSSTNTRYVHANLVTRELDGESFPIVHKIMKERSTSYKSMEYKNPNTGNTIEMIISEFAMPENQRIQ